MWMADYKIEMNIKKKLFKIIWMPISILEKGYWYVKRNIQHQDFQECGANVFISRGCYFSGKIYLGNDIYIGQGCRIQSTKKKITIGNHVMFGPNVTIHSGNHRVDVIGKYIKDITLEEKKSENDKDVFIEDDVWIGGGAIILQGVIIGKGSVIGAGSVITKNVVPYSIVAGSPLQKKWKRFDQESIIKHEAMLKE
jgi:acetyltransferase-like isoleucine patch superfamily enzyme